VTYAGRGPRGQPRYRTRPVGVRQHALAAGREATVALSWRDGSPLGSWSSGCARPAADGSLPAAWLLAQWPPQVSEPTDYWLADRPETTPLAELVRRSRR
jgi:hypothetical protein